MMWIHKNRIVSLVVLLIIIVVFCALNSCAKKSNEEFIIESAFEITKRIDSSSDRGSMQGMIASKYAESGNYEKAIEIAKEIGNSSMKYIAFWWISKSLAKDLKFEEALQIANKIEDSRSKGNALADISVAFVENGQYENALMLSDSIADVSLRIWTLVEIAKLFYEEEKGEDASKIMEKALVFSKSIANEAEKDNSLGIISCGYAKINKHEKSLDISCSIDNDGKRAGALKNIAEVLIESGDTTQALAVLVQAFNITKGLEDSPDLDEQRLLAGIGAKFFKAGAYEKGTQIIRSIDRDILKIRNLAWLGFRYEEKGQTEEATRLFNEALGIAEKIENAYYRALAFSSLAKNHKEEEENQIAFELLEKALESTERIEKRSQKVMALHSIAWGFIDINENEKALEICKQLNDSPFRQAMSLVNLAKHYSESDQEMNEKIRKIVSEIASNQ